MASKNVQVKETIYCIKCGGIMITRLIAEKNGSTKPIMTRILQCRICKHWKRL